MTVNLIMTVMGMSMKMADGDEDAHRVVQGAVGRSALVADRSDLAAESSDPGRSDLAAGRS